MAAYTTLDDPSAHFQVAAYSGNGGTLASGTYLPIICNHSYATASSSSLNFGNPAYANSSDAADGNGYGAFEYAPPSGFLALCTKNLGSTGG